MKSAIFWIKMNYGLKMMTMIKIIKTNNINIKMNNVFNGVILLIGLMAVLTSCRDNGDDLLDPNHYPNSDTMSGQFEAIWHGINQN